MFKHYTQVVKRLSMLKLYTSGQNVKHRWLKAK